MIRKIVGIAAVMAACAAFAVDAEQDVSEQGEGAVGWTAAQVGIFSPISYPQGGDWDVYGVDLNLFYMENVRLQGVGLSLCATRTHDIMKGAVGSLFLNWSDKDVSGVRVALLGVNYARNDVYGLDWGFFGLRKNMWGVDFNLIGSHQENFQGIQFGSICNFTYQEFKGIDAAFGLNFACDAKGAQIGGVNFAHQFRGCQLGFFNIAEECPNGIQIGLINIIMDNTIKVLPLVNFYFD